MRKKNKILMMAISSLLCLTLISSCLVSSIFSKYVTTDTASVSTVFKKWGVNVEVDVNDDLEYTVNGGTVTISDINIKPGDDFSDAVRFTITGTPEVKCKVQIGCNIVYVYKNNNSSTNSNYKYSNFRVSSDLASAPANDDKYFMPIGFTFAAPKSRTSTDYIIPRTIVVSPWREYTGINPSSSSSPLGMDTTEKAIANAIKGKMNGFDGSSSTDTAGSGGYYCSKSFTNSNANKIEFFASSGNTTTPINTFEFGFYWPYEYDGSETEIAKYDEYSNIIAANAKENEGLFTITYFVSVQQIS